MLTVLDLSHGELGGYMGSRRWLNTKPTDIVLT